MIKFFVDKFLLNLLSFHISSFFSYIQIFDYTELSQAQVILPVSGTGDDQQHGATVVALVNNGVIQHHPHVAATAAQANNGSNPVTTVTVANTVNTNSNGSNSSTTSGSTKSRRSWHEYGRNSEVDKVQIPKLYVLFQNFRIILE